MVPFFFNPNRAAFIFLSVLDVGSLQDLVELLIRKEGINLGMVLCLVHNYRAVALVSRQDHNVLPLLQIIKGLLKGPGRLDGGSLALVRTPAIFKCALSTSDPVKPCRPPSIATMISSTGIHSVTAKFFG